MFLDAVVVRCLLLPAVLDILGSITWSIPRRLDWLLPRLNVEGSAARLTPADEAEFAAFASGEQPVPTGAREGTEG